MTSFQRFDEIRAAIDASDRRVLAAVNERLRLVDELWQLKLELGVDRVDSTREREIFEALRAANQGPLTDDGVDELVVELLALTKREHGRREG